MGFGVGSWGLVRGLRFGVWVWGLEFGVWGLGFGVYGLWFRTRTLWFSVQGSGFRV